MVKVSEIGEFGLIERISKLVGPPKKDVLIGIGDDAAIVAATDAPLAITTDIMVEGVHFTSEMPPRAIGYKALAVNISDIAALAGEPKYAVISLGLREDTEVDFVDEIYRGIVDCAGRFGVQLIGGDITKSPIYIINIALTGTVDGEIKQQRGRARAGDTILVSGHLGASALGLEIIKSKRAIENSDKVKFAHYYPLPRVVEAKIAAAAGCGAIEDISDGLVRDLGNICRAAGVGAEIQTEKIPIDNMTINISKELAIDPLEAALSGGEDYELIIISPSDKVKGVIDNVTSRTGTKITPIGKIVTRQGLRFLQGDGSNYHLSGVGYDHFKSS